MLVRSPNTDQKGAQSPLNALERQIGSQLVEARSHVHDLVCLPEFRFRMCVSSAMHSLCLTLRKINTQQDCAIFSTSSNETSSRATDSLIDDQVAEQMQTPQCRRLRSMATTSRSMRFALQLSNVSNLCRCCCLASLQSPVQLKHMPPSISAIMLRQKPAASRRRCSVQTST